ncbi:hypothetical protein EYR38_002972 [Pleurotus pulmonarius]|nr:hypothetical protein EYR38_002972 [Pleurotus pulmonarius]
MPPEVLSRIFSILASDLFGRIGSSLDWIIVTHVCKFWYHVARDNPTLWSSINFIHPRWAKEKLTRTKSVPLRLDYQHNNIQRSEKAGQEALSLALNKLPLIKTVTIEGPADVLEGFIKEMCGLPAPLMEDLRLISPKGDAINTTAIWGSLFNGIAPRLKYVAFLGVSIDFKTTLFRSVEVLILGPMPHLVSIPDMLELLSNLPKLVELRLSFAFRQPDDTQAARLADTEPVLMPSCRLVQAIGVGNDVSPEHPVATPTMFLRWLRFAQPVDLELTMSWDADEFPAADPDTLEQIFGPLSSHYAVHGTQYSHLEVTRTARPPMDAVTEQIDIFAQGKNDASILLTFWFLHEVHTADCRQLVEEFARHLPRADLRSVNIAAVDIGAYAWYSLFGELRHLQEIKTYLYEGVPHALLMNDTGGYCIFPSLTKLTLYFDAEDEEKSKQGCWRRLPEVLEFRATHGAPVREIEILPEDEVPEEYLAPLAGFVVIRR